MNNDEKLETLGNQHLPDDFGKNQNLSTKQSPQNIIIIILSIGYRGRC